MNEKRSLYAGIPAHLPEELCDTLASAGSTRSTRIERIVSRGHTSPEGFWYDQTQHEFVLLVKGRAGLRFEGDAEPVVLEAGEYLDIPARVRHRVEWTDPEGDTVWLAVHYGDPAETERR
ncbi:MAG TPA: cupin domain-containing protein [Deferrisomatales bacterium]|nr:cupin domain-containing protein [Deferrisomatales bacterium]